MASSRRSGLLQLRHGSGSVTSFMTTRYENGSLWFRLHPINILRTQFDFPPWHHGFECIEASSPEASLLHHLLHGGSFDYGIDSGHLLRITTSIMISKYGSLLDKPSSTIKKITSPWVIYIAKSWLRISTLKR